MPDTLDNAIAAARNEDYLRALTLFLDVYGGEETPPIRTPRDASGLSFFGLALALVGRKFKPAIDLCKRAIDLEFYNSEHYVNLAKVYVAAGNRKKALDTVESGLKLVPEDEALMEVRQSLGIRSRPAVPFLDRSNPINVSLGQARHAKKLADEQASKKRR